MDKSVINVIITTQGFGYKTSSLGPMKQVNKNLLKKGKM